MTSDRTSLFPSGINLMFLILAFAVPLFAGQSLVLTANGPTYEITDPGQPYTRSWRVEFQVHNITPPAAGQYSQQLFALNGEGLQVFIEPNRSLALTDRADANVGGAPCTVSTA